LDLMARSTIVLPLLGSLMLGDEVAEGVAVEVGWGDVERRGTDVLVGLGVAEVLGIAVCPGILGVLGTVGVLGILGVPGTLGVLGKPFCAWLVLMAAAAKVTPRAVAKAPRN
jgi:hypothetical protein